MEANYKKIIEKRPKERPMKRMRNKQKGPKSFRNHKFLSTSEIFKYLPPEIGHTKKLFKLTQNQTKTP
jgi:hypothetical protein